MFQSRAHAPAAGQGSPDAAWEGLMNHRRMSTPHIAAAAASSRTRPACERLTLSSITTGLQEFHMSELSRDKQPSTDLSELSVPAADAGQELSSAAAPGDAAAPARRTVPGSHLVETVKDHLKVAVAAGAAFFAAAPDADGAVI